MFAENSRSTAAIRTSFRWKLRPAKGLMRGRFGCRVHAVLRHFVNSAQWLFLMKSEKLIQRSGAFADRVGFLDRLGHVSLRQNHGFAQLQPARQLRQKRR